MGSTEIRQAFAQRRLQTPRSCQTFFFPAGPVIWSVSQRCVFLVLFVVFLSSVAPTSLWEVLGTLVGQRLVRARTEHLVGGGSGFARAARAGGKGGGGGLYRPGPRQVSSQRAHLLLWRLLWRSPCAFGIPEGARGR